MLEWIKKNPLTFLFRLCVASICLILLGVGIYFIIKEVEKSKTPSKVYEGSGVADINVDNKPMMTIDVKEKIELNNITIVSKIRLVNCKITLYKDLNYTGEKEEYEHVYLLKNGAANFVKEFDGTNTNNMFKSLIIEPKPIPK
jgi:hypothetical protein